MKNETQRKCLAALLAAALLLAALWLGPGQAQGGQMELTEEERQQNVCRIAFSQGGIFVSDPARASVSGHRVTLSAEGPYVLSGSSRNAQVLVYQADSGTVELRLRDLDLTCRDSAPLWVENAAAVRLVLEGQSALSDTEYYSQADGDKPDACLYSSSALTVEGNGTLTLTGQFRNGLTAQAGFEQRGGSLTITAVNNGIKSSRSIVVKDGRLDVCAGNDGLKADDSNNEAVGQVCIEGGSVTVDAGDDALQAGASLIVSGGELHADAAGRLLNCPGETEIAPGCLYGLLTAEKREEG